MDRGGVSRYRLTALAITLDWHRGYVCRACLLSSENRCSHFRASMLLERLSNTVSLFSYHHSQRRLTPMTVGNGMCAVVLPPNKGFQNTRFSLCRSPCHNDSATSTSDDEPPSIAIA